MEILIDRLKGGQTQKIEEKADPTFLGPEEKELGFPARVSIQGETYLTDGHLILHLKAHTTVKMPCSVCNQMTEVPLKIENFYLTQPIEEIPSAVFDYSAPLREALLIELPKTVECNRGKCPERSLMEPYLRPPARDKTTYFPFADMDDLKEK